MRKEVKCLTQHRFHRWPTRLLPVVNVVEAKEGLKCLHLL